VRPFYGSGRRDFSGAVYLFVLCLAQGRKILSSGQQVFIVGTGVHMSDFLFLAVLFAFFAMATGFVLGLEKL